MSFVANLFTVVGEIFSVVRQDEKIWLDDMSFDSRGLDVEVIDERWCSVIIYARVGYCGTRTLIFIVLVGWFVAFLALKVLIRFCLFVGIHVIDSRH